MSVPTDKPPFSLAIEAKQNSISSNAPGAWLVVGLLMGVGCLNYLVRIMVTTMKGSIIEEIPMTDTQFGLLTSVFLWVYGILSPFAGFLSDRFNRSHVIIGSLMIWSLVTWASSLATTFNELLVSRVLMGISEACYIPAALALIADYHKGPTRSFATGLHMAGIMAGSALSFTGGWFAEKNDWEYPFKFFGIIGVVYAIILVVILKDPPKYQHSVMAEMVPENKNKVNFVAAVKSLFSRRSFILVFFYWGLLGLSWVIVGWLPTYYKEYFNLSQGQASVYATAYLYAMSFAGVLLGGLLADFWSRRNIRGPILLPALGLCICAVAIFVAGTTSTLPIAVTGFMLYALTISFSDSNGMPILCLVSDAKYRATGYGILNMLSCIVGGLGVYASGVGLDAHVDFRIIFQFLSLLVLISALILFLVKPSVKA